jgi:phosphoglycerate dehydrogenase-like enzyme
MPTPSQPTIAIIDWRTAPQGDPESTLEKAIIGEAASVSRHLCDTDADLDAIACAAQAIILWHNLPLTATGIARLTHCRAIIRNGVGYDSVDLAAARAHRIPVCNVPDYGTEEVADHAIALTLALCRQLFPLDHEAKQLRWTIPIAPQLRRLSTLTFGIIGLGRIGTATALRAKALGFRVLFHDPYLPNGVDKALGLQRATSLDELLAQTDVLSVHCPLNAETHHLIAEPQLAQLKSNAFVVNTARGGIIKKTALLAALRSGQLAGAGLDVIEDEPLRTPEEAATPNLIATCHAAFCSVESKIEMRRTSARIARAAVLGLPLENVVA